ncbi:hypothetical protein U14_02110 [Candidatus Moduliflexus flocculans]|uniref:PIN domain-containing protein n=1 Tax=Candidatus Moduliflexus flocculans TaxID=1499966 RepID=A0A0S6VTL2_9BACT|nr:hypothetical protein U14_02110 [Candidatus Moduliflexus flocculans]
MLKDIFIDNNIAKNFSNPLDIEYKKFIQWLMRYDVQEPSKNAYLVVSQKLIAEYQRTTRNSFSPTNIAIIIDRLTREGRLIKISNQEIKDFKQKYFIKKVIRKLTCNHEDWEHIPVVLLSHRKYALSLDDKFIHDLRNFPGFNVLIEKRPEDLSYE